MLELDSANGLEFQTPRTHLKLANFTFISKGSNANGVAMMMRGGADASLVNGVLVAPTIPCLQFNSSGLDILSPANAGQDKAGPPVFKSVAMQCSSPAFVGTNGVTAQQVQDTFTAGTVANTFTFTPSATLGTSLVNGANETAIGATDPQTIDAAFDTTTWVGAVRDSNDTWFRDWTCNSSTANFVASPATRSLCTSLPSLL
jgi:hypothetical protein